MKSKLIAGAMLALFLVGMLSTGAPILAAPSIPGDVNDDGTVNIQDVVLATLAFGSSINETGIEGEIYNPNADFNNDTRVDIFDLVIIGVNFGRTG